MTEAVQSRVTTRLELQLPASSLTVRPVGADGVTGTLDDNLRLQPDSPAIDAGDNSAVPADTLDLDGDGNTTEPLPYDLAGNPRFIEHPRPDSGSGTPPLVDMGAYEMPGFWFTKTVSPGLLNAGEMLTYTIAFRTSELTATHIVITDVIPISISVTSVGLAIHFKPVRMVSRSPTVIASLFTSTWATVCSEKKSKMGCCTPAMYP